MYYFSYQSPVGPLFLTSTGTVLTALHFEHTGHTRQDALPIFTQAQQWLNAYFAKQPLPQLPPLAPQGTPFQQRVWQLLRQIPYGASVTYGELARQLAQQLGKPHMSAQAVGQAIHRNPLSIIIPCHRVLGAKRQLTGYAGGLDKKIKLLQLENIPFLPLH